jgi:very-short-patch-repair endonuclease
MGAQAVSPQAAMPQQSPSPLAGEGARRADEGSASPPADARESRATGGIPDPSSGATRHLLPQWEKEALAPHHREISPFLRGAARRLRRTATTSEAKLWALLRARRFVDYKFRRQVPVGPYVADFVCFSARLIVELDGSQHADSPSDNRRDAWFLREGFRTLRIWNTHLLADRNSVSDAIWNALQEPTS